MSLRARLLLSFAAILVIALGVNWFVVSHLARRELLNESIERATALADILEMGREFAAAMPDRIENIVGGQMLVQAALTAHLVDVAENHAHLSPEEISERLKHVANWTAIDEFWVTDEEGYAYIRNREYGFAFPEEPTERGQAHEFRFLLDSRDGRLIQRSMPRELDEQIFKYAAVSGVDGSRIVQVGYMADSLLELIDGVRPGDVLSGVAGHGGIQRVMLLHRDGEILIDARPDHEWTSGGIFDEDDELLAVLGDAIDGNRPVGRMKEETLAVVYPPEGRVDGTALVTFFDASGVREMTLKITIYMAVAAAALLALGLLISWRISRQIADPIRELAAEAELIGQGDLERSLRVRAGAEVGALANSLNAMVGSLKTHVEQLREATAMRERMETELRVAAQVQTAMLPPDLPSNEHVRVSAISDPARVVGGDFFDIMKLPDGRIAITVGDASGKGLPAALFATQCLSMLRALALNPHDELHPGEILEEANRVMLDTCRTEELFVTLFYGILDPVERSLTFANAAHLPPVLQHGEDAGRIEYAASLPMGILPEFRALEDTIYLSRGDTLLLYTDGVTEAESASGEFFGLGGLIDAAKGLGGLTPDEMTARIRDAVNGFSASKELNDDMTIVAIRLM